MSETSRQPESFGEPTKHHPDSTEAAIARIRLDYDAGLQPSPRDVERACIGYECESRMSAMLTRKLNELSAKSLELAGLVAARQSEGGAA